VQFKDWTTRAEIIAFFAGGGGMALMFYRWRMRGDRLAKVLCLAAFGTWALACFIWPVGGAHAGEPGSPGFDAAAIALLAGFVGGIIVLIRGSTRTASIVPADRSSDPDRNAKPDDRRSYH
jgi:peptidoglycan/LPS O-acetylase OafA/YrhL